jgi:PKD repeat protein
MFVGRTLIDYGTLSPKAVSTDSSGMATAIYTVPPAPSIAVDNDTTVTITALPDGADFANTLNNACDASPIPNGGFCTPPSVNIRLVTPGTILGPNPTVTASFSFSPTQPQEDQQVQFDASSSTGANLTYSWAFGDGKTGTGVRPTHTYSVSGTYGVILTVTDDRGTSASSVPISVQVAPAADPTADFVISPLDPTINTDVFFDGSLSKTPLGSGRTIVSYDWNFGDGAPSGSGQKVSHQYTKAGTYTVVLNVRDSSGRRGTLPKNIQVK